MCDFPGTPAPTSGSANAALLYRKQTRIFKCVAIFAVVALTDSKYDNAG